MAQTSKEQPQVSPDSVNRPGKAPVRDRTGVLAPVKRRVKSALHGAYGRYLRLFRAFGPEDLLTHLRRLGLKPGNRILVHSSFGQFGGFRGTPSDVIATLCRAVGPHGAVMMPTMPFSGLAIDYARSGAVLDVRRTPSKMGVLSEVFRRTPGVVRSVHPTHPVAIWGADAETLAQGHADSHTPCGAGSPFHKLLETRGRILFLGTDIFSLTFLHTLEEIYEPRLPRSPFTTEVFHLSTRDASGALRTTDTRLFDPGVARRRRPDRLVPELRRAGAWHSKKLKTLPITLFDTEAARAAYEVLCDRQTYCYDFSA
jgi:aminoglycoside 3-N-acetyltransferase